MTTETSVKVSADERRKRALTALRALYVEAEVDVEKAPDEAMPGDLERLTAHRKGVLEGIRRVARDFYGVIDEKVVTKGETYVGNRGEEDLSSAVLLNSREVEVLGLTLRDRVRSFKEHFGPGTKAVFVKLRILTEGE